MKLTDALKKYFEEAGVQNDDEITFPTQDCMTLAMNLMSVIRTVAENKSRSEPGKDDYEHEYLLGWNKALQGITN